MRASVLRSHKSGAEEWCTLVLSCLNHNVAVCYLVCIQTANCILARDWSLNGLKAVGDCGIDRRARVFLRAIGRGLV